MMNSKYIKRKNEVIKYFELLKCINHIAPKLNFNELVPVEVADDVQMVSKSRIHAIDNDLIDIMHANGFLILYNLIEATMKDVYIVIFDEISNSKISFDQLVEEVQIEWVSYELRDHKSGARPKTVTELANKIISNPDFIIDRDKLKFGGNLDAREIKTYAKNLKVSEPFHPQQDLLVVIKELRNQLAHGGETFIDVGKKYKYSDIEPYQIATFGLLESLISNVTTYLNFKNYKKCIALNAFQI
ncbi:MAG: hypothetical protein K2Y14_01535 [Burkholderiales bacterium]|nr:hypothetical protein [Burkholderiales bacterium]